MMVFGLVEWRPVVHERVGLGDRAVQLVERPVRVGVDTDPAVGGGVVRVHVPHQEIGQLLGRRAGVVEYLADRHAPD